MVTQSVSTAFQYWLSQRAENSLHGHRLSRRFWLNHALLPAIALCAVLAIAGFSTLDLQIARSTFFDVANQRWRGADSWWANDLIHIGGRDALRVLAAIAAMLLLASLRMPALHRWRRPLAYYLSAMLASTLLVGALKQLTNVDCPWDLQGFGGTRPIVHLFADRPDDLPRAACFPGAHSSSGFALMCLYFLLRQRSAVAAYAGLGIGMVVGSVFAVGQEARGAHFLSHDLCSALLVWLICLGVYVWPFRGNVAPSAMAVASLSAS